jgi:hypothetical protein
MSAEAGTWLPAKRKYLLPEKPLARIFRAKFRDLLKKAGLFHLVPSQVWRQNWVVDIISVGSGEAALKYLAPYVFRVAITNRNILSLKNGQVTFRYRHSKTNASRTTTLPASNFISRFLQHVLPRGLQKVRTYGVLHPKQRNLLAFVKEQLHQERSATSELSHHSHLARCTSGLPAPLLCPKCACQMIHIAEIPRKRGPP